jgi:hypothetical protein
LWTIIELPSMPLTARRLHVTCAFSDAIEIGAGQQIPISSRC